MKIYVLVQKTKPSRQNPQDGCKEDEDMSAGGDADKMLRLSKQRERRNSLFCGLERANTPETELLQPIPSPQSPQEATEVPAHHVMTMTLAENKRKLFKIRFFIS